MGSAVMVGGVGRLGEGAFAGEKLGSLTMVSVRALAVRMRSGMAAASGRLRQYFLGISDVMAPIFRRAGLKILL